MSEHLNEISVKVNVDTNKFSKDLKKLRRSFKDMFNTKATNKEMVAFEKELKDIARLPFNPFKDWNAELIKTEKVLKRVGAKTLRQQIKEYKSLAKEFRSTGMLEQAKGYEKMAKAARSKKKAGFRYDYDPTQASIQYMRGKYGAEQWEKASKYQTKLYYENEQRKMFKEEYGALKDAKAKYNEIIKSGQKPDIGLKRYVEGDWRTTKGIPAEEKKKYSEMQKEYEAFKKRQEKALEARDKGKGGKGFLGRVGNAAWKAITAFPKMLWRIFTRYIGYQIIKNIFGEFEQGMQNLYKWSVQNKKEWADIFDKSKSMSTALGNALAVVKTYLTLWITKVFTSIKGFLVDFLNAVSKFISWITLQKTYVQANKDIMTRWAENNAETRQLIQGFDKLNIWKGNDNTQPKDMFTEYSWAEDKGWLGKLFSGGTPVKEVGKTIGKQLAEGFVTYVLSSNPMDIGGFSAGAQQTEESKSIWQRIKDFFAGLWEGLKLGWGKVKEWFNGILQKIKTWWNGVTTEDEDGAGGTYTRTVEPGFKHALKEWFAGVWTNIKEWFVGNRETGTEGIWQKHIKPVFESLWEKFSGWMENTFVPLISKIWNQSTIKKKIDDEKDTLADIGYSIANILPWNWWKIQTGERPQVRPNANGGVYTTPTLGLVGEASSKGNPEIITPQALLDERLEANNRELLGAMNGMFNNLIGAVQGINMEVKIGDDVIARSASRGNNSYYKMTGRPLIR